MASPTLPKSTVARLEKITGTKALLPYLRAGKPAYQFKRLRQAVYDETGFDHLTQVRLLEVLGYISPLPTLEYRSPHVRGDCFDIDRNDPKFFIQSDAIAGQQFWRLFVKSNRKGQVLNLRTDKGDICKDRLFDFTKLAEGFGFQRVPAYRGWEADARLKLWWHYQLADNLTWAECVHFLYGRHIHERPMRLALNDRTFGLGDRSIEVRNLQTQLESLALLPTEEIDGVFGLPTKQAVSEFQVTRKLITDHKHKGAGIADPHTRRALIREVLSLMSHKERKAR